MPNTDVSQFPSEVANELQGGYLEKAYQPGLEPNEAYGLACSPLTLPAHTGDTLTRTKPGLLGSKEDPVDPSVAVGLQNGMTDQQWGNEQYTVTMELFNGTVPIDIKTSPMGITDRTRQGFKGIAKQSLQSVDKYRRNILLGGLVVSKGSLKLFSGYAGGNTVVTGAGNTSTTSIPVDDVSGFTRILVNGDMADVSAGNPMPIYKNGILFANVVGYTVDEFVTPGSNASLRKQRNSPNRSASGASGTLITAATCTTVAGDILQAAYAPKIIRPNGKNHFTQLGNSDLLNGQAILAAVSWMRDSNIPPVWNDRYLCVTTNSAWNQLFSDPDFKQAAQSRIDSGLFRGGILVEYLGVVFVFSTNAAIQDPSTGVVGCSRTFVLGQDALVDGISAVNGMFANIPEGEKKMVYTEEHRGIVTAVRPPIDAQGRFLQVSWESIRGNAVASDATATGIVDTAGSSYFKRAVLIEHKSTN
jgi:hypothetical protein